MSLHLTVAILWKSTGEGSLARCCIYIYSLRCQDPSSATKMMSTRFLMRKTSPANPLFTGAKACSTWLVTEINLIRIMLLMAAVCFDTVKINHMYFAYLFHCVHWNSRNVGGYARWLRHRMIRFVSGIRYFRYFLRNNGSKRTSMLPWRSFKLLIP